MRVKRRRAEIRKLAPQVQLKPLLGHDGKAMTPGDLMALGGHCHASAITIARLDGLGDIIFMEPALRRWKGQNPQTKVIFYTKPHLAYVPALIGADETRIAQAQPADFGGFWLNMALEGHPASYCMDRVSLWEIVFGLEPTDTSPQLPILAGGAELLAADPNYQSDKPSLYFAPFGAHQTRSLPDNVITRILPVLGEKYNVVMPLPNKFKPPKMAEGVLVFEECSIENFFKMVAACDIGLATDSGGLYVAGALGLPAIGLFEHVYPSLRIRRFPSLHGVQLRHTWCDCDHHSFVNCAESGPRSCKGNIEGAGLIEALQDLENGRKGSWNYWTKEAVPPIRTDVILPDEASERQMRFAIEAAFAGLDWREVEKYSEETIFGLQVPTDLIPSREQVWASFDMLLNPHAGMGELDPHAPLTKGPGATDVPGFVHRQAEVKPVTDKAALHIWRSGGLGDFVFLIPALRRLKAAAPEREIVIHAPGSLRTLIPLLGDLTFQANETGQCEGEGIDLHGTIEGHERRNELDRVTLFEMILGLSVSQDEPRLRLPTMQDQIEAHEARRPGMPLLFFAPFTSVPGLAGRSLPVEKANELMRELRGKYDIVMAAQHDFPEGARLETVLSFAQTTGPDFLALIGSCHKVFANDSGSAYLAAAAGIPTIALYDHVRPILRMRRFPKLFALDLRRRGCECSEEAECSMPLNGENRCKAELDVGMIFSRLDECEQRGGYIYSVATGEYIDTRIETIPEE